MPADVLAAMEPPETRPARRWTSRGPSTDGQRADEFLLCMDDLFFPPEWMRGVVRDRLGIEPIEVPGGHCAYLSQPRPLAEALVRLLERARAARSRATGWVAWDARR